MRRQDKLRIIAAALDGDDVVAVQPDLPELFEGPDVLAGRAGRLVAVFTPKVHELSRPDRLVTRLVLSRLALPDHVRCALVLERAQEFMLQVAELAYGFQVVDWVDDSDLSGLRRSRRESQPIPEQTRRFVEARASFLFAASRQTPEQSSPRRRRHVDREYRVALTSLAREGNFERVDPSIMGMMRRDAAERLAERTWSYQGVLVTSEVIEHQSIRKQLLPFVTLARNVSFHVDKGVPHLKQPALGVFLTGSVGSGPDPLKTQRASAFAGWQVLVQPSPDDFQESLRRNAAWLHADGNDVQP